MGACTGPVCMGQPKVHFGTTVVGSWGWVHVRVLLAPSLSHLPTLTHANPYMMCHTGLSWFTDWLIYWSMAGRSLDLWLVHTLVHGLVDLLSYGWYTLWFMSW